MSVPALISAAVLWGLFQPTDRPTATQVYSEGEWVLTVRTDRFTQQTRCRLANRHGRRPDVTAVPGALAFRFSPKLDTSDAWYRIDDSPPQPWADAYAKLIAAGSLNQAERLDNATGGVVLIPLADITGAGQATIRPTPKAALRLFKFGQAWTMLAAAEQMACGFDNANRSAEGFHLNAPPAVISNPGGQK